MLKASSYSILRACQRRVVGAITTQCPSSRSLTFIPRLQSFPFGACRGVSPIQVVTRRNFARPAARERPAPITLTENAVKRIKHMIDDKDDKEIVGIRIGVKRRGCNGYSYTMNYAKKDDANNTKDDKVTKDGLNIFIDPKAIFFLVGTEMDYVETELSAEFTFNNPNSKGQCGCGESFNV